MEIKKLEDKIIKSIKIESYEIKTSSDLIESFQKALKEINKSDRCCLYIDDKIKSTFTTNTNLIINDIRSQISSNVEVFQIKYLNF